MAAIVLLPLAAFAAPGPTPSPAPTAQVVRALPATRTPSGSPTQTDVATSLPWSSLSQVPATARTGASATTARTPTIPAVKPTAAPTSTTAPSPTLVAQPTSRPAAIGWQQTPSPTVDPPPAPASTPETLPEDADAFDPSEDPDDFDWRAFVPTDPRDHVAWIQLAAARSGCGVPWQVLAAIARVESDFGRNMATSSAGAIGYGQFLPTSWQAFGQSGNAYDYRDVLPAIARYLCRHGMANDPRQAIFAYNHADWYVDLVLGLAARYDRVAPAGMTQAVLGLGSGQPPAIPLHFAAGRDSQAQARAGQAGPGSVWLAVPFVGRRKADASAWQPTLDMLRTAFQLGEPAEAAGDDLVAFANSAWDAGLDLLGGPGAFHTWSIDEARAFLTLGHPVVALVHGRALPGHAPDEPDTDQPIALVGVSGDGGSLVYHDPSFASSLGYALELTATDFQAAWDQASTPRRAVAFARRPAPPARAPRSEPPPTA
ncbi:MAG TPA: lytic murein transglycosylase, partial [Chloroflexota bacterium]|nr:lytic murein transglycosylase [Chloroflexota bacterium]